MFRTSQQVHTMYVESELAAARYKLLWKSLRTSRSVDPQNMLSRAAETYSNDKF